MNSPQKHYETFLAKKYAWMLGDWEEKVAEQNSLFSSWNLEPQGNKIAWDLGAGNGVQSLPLEKLGFQVLAVDFSPELLSEISERKPDTKIQTKLADIRSRELYQGEAPELLVCMGDTITHLESFSEIEELVSHWSHFLKPGNRLAIGYRDLSYGKEGEKSGFNVRAEKEKIFSCLLRFGKEKTEITDIFQEWNGKDWVFSSSSYNKLTIPLDRLLNILSPNGFELLQSEDRRGMKYILSQKS